MKQRRSSSRHGFHVLAKPIGPLCNLDCRYCFYLEKQALYPGEVSWRMDGALLEEFVRQYIEAQPGPEVHFAWQGGEPTLLGVDFFQQVVRLQRRYGRGRPIDNAFQTNGVLLDDAWGEFLAENRFLVGLSLDGPRELHDRYRVDRRQQPTFDAVMRGLEVLKKHEVEFNLLTVINRANAGHPAGVYRFLREAGGGFIQFIPLVERPARPGSPATLAAPPESDQPCEASPAVTEWSVEAAPYGEFLCGVFDEWVRRDVGKVFVQIFDVALGNWMGLGSPLCVFAETCGNAVALEHNGDLYSCDHFVYPRHRLGNLRQQALRDLVRSSAQKRFGAAKRDRLPRQCRECPVLFACNGECPKHRFLTSSDGEPGLNYLCAGYRRFFTYIDPWMRAMAGLLERGLPAAAIMEMPDPRGFVPRDVR